MAVAAEPPPGRRGRWAQRAPCARQPRKYTGINILCTVWYRIVVLLHSISRCSAAAHSPALTTEPIRSCRRLLHVARGGGTARTLRAAAPPCVETVDVHGPASSLVCHLIHFAIWPIHQAGPLSGALTVIRPGPRAGLSVAATRLLVALARGPRGPPRRAPRPALGKWPDQSNRLRAERSSGPEEGDRDCFRQGLMNLSVGGLGRGARRAAVPGGVPFGRGTQAKVSAAI